MIRVALASLQQAVLGLSTVSSDVPSMGISAHATRSQLPSTWDGVHVQLTQPSLQQIERKNINQNTLPEQYRPKVDLTAMPTYNGSSLNGFFTGVSMSGNGQYVATVTTSQAILISSNYGKTFTTANAPNATFYTLNRIAIASSAPQYMIVGNDYGVYVSTNYGTYFATASSSSLLTQCRTVTISGNGQYAYVIANSMLYASSDYLSSFSITTAPTGYYGSVAISTDGSTVYATTYNTLYKYSTSGTIWTQLYPVITSLETVATSNTGQYLAVLDNFGNVYVSNNYGDSSSWTAYGTSTTSWETIIMSSTGQYIYTEGYDGGIYYSSNYGKSFSQTQSPPVDYQSMAMNSAGNSVIAVSSEGSIYQTTNYGKTWTPNHYDWNDVAMSQNGITSFAVANGFVSMTTNSGKTWLQTGYSSTNTYSFLDASCDSTCQYIIVASKYNVFLTSDYGQTWTSPTTLSITYGVNSLAMSSTGQYITIGLMNDYIYTSSDYGVTWIISSSLAKYWASIAMSYSGQYQIAIGSTFEGSSGNIFLSTDYGSTWNQVNSMSLTYIWTSVASDSTGMNLIATSSSSSAVYYSNDYGSTWNLAITTTSATWASSAVSSTGQYMYAASSNGILYQSSNSGSSWAQLSSVPVWNYNAIACDSTGQYVTLVAYSGPVLRSSDYGSTWSTQNIVFSTSNDFGNFDYHWQFFDDDDTVETLAIGAIIGIALGGCACCCCLAALIGYCFFGLCQKKSILKVDAKDKHTVEIEMDKV